MSRERRAGTKALVIVFAVVVLTALLAYFLHLRPAEEATEPAPAGVERTEQPPTAPAPQP